LVYLTIASPLPLLFGSVSDEEFTINYMDDRKNHDFPVIVQEEKTTDGGNEVIDVLQINEQSVADIRDMRQYSMKIVHNGRALFLEKPVYVQIWKDGFSTLIQSREEIKNEDIRENLKNSAQSFAIKVNRAKSLGWTTRRILMWLPDGGRCTADLSSTCTMRDGPVPINGRQIPYTAQLTRAELLVLEAEQIAQPLWWKVRLVPQTEEARKVVTTKPEADDDFLRAFAGMAQP
jgi:hypothetical protein